KEQDRAFQTLKDKLCNAPVLALLDGLEDFVIKLFSDYDCEIRYHPSKANVVADALSRKERIKPKRVRAMNMTIQSSIRDKILAAQNEASKAINAPAEMLRGLDEQMECRSDGTLYYLDRIWVPLTGGVRTQIMGEAHKSRYSVHPGADKMYYDLRDMYWWPRMKKGYSRDYRMERLARLYLNEIVARHGVPITIISDLDSQFASQFWQSMQEALGTRMLWRKSRLPGAPARALAPISRRPYGPNVSFMRISRLREVARMTARIALEIAPEFIYVMAISVISISSDSSEDSVGTPAGRVILFGTIPTTIPDTTPVITPPATQTDTTVDHSADPFIRTTYHIPSYLTISSSDDAST
ncbi:putative reverse transcriptase domain-containing protein, partial [Tanacetum coccineum]